MSDPTVKQTPEQWWATVQGPPARTPDYINSNGDMNSDDDDDDDLGSQVDAESDILTSELDSDAEPDMPALPNHEADQEQAAVVSDVDQSMGQCQTEPKAASILVSSALPTGSCSKEAYEEQLRQIDGLLTYVPDSNFIWDGKPHCSIPKVIKYVYASGLDSAQAQQWLQTRFALIDDSLVVNVTSNGPTKLKDELSGRLHTWWNDRTMDIYENSSERKNSMWFFRLRNLVRNCLGSDMYQSVGLMDLEKKLKRIQRQAHASEKAANASASKRAFYQTYVELSGDSARENLGLQSSDDVFPVECNASAIKEILNCLKPQRIVQHARTLRFICKHLGYLDRVQNKIIVDADDVSESELEGPFPLSSKARCVLRLKELLSDQLSDLDFAHGGQVACTVSVRIGSVLRYCRASPDL